MSEFDEIQLITREEARDLITSRNRNVNSLCDYEPLGKFYQITTGHDGNTVYIAYDNSDGHCWVEEFYSIGACMAWLRGANYD